MTEQRVQILGNDDDDLAVDSSLIEPLDEDTAGRTITVDPKVITNIVVAEPPAPPLQLPTDAPTAEGIQALQKLGGYATSVDWLPEGLSPELDAIRERHLDLVSRLSACLNEIQGLEPVQAGGPGP
jgi:hypothetical protein